MIVRSKANELLQRLFGDGKNDYYIGLGLADYEPDGNGNNFEEPSIPTGAVDDDGEEIKTNEYQRVHLAGVMGTAANGIIKNDKIIFFNEAEHYSWGKIGYFGIFTSESGGTPIFWGEVPETIINQNYIPIFRAGKLQVGLDNDPANPT